MKRIGIMGGTFDPIHLGHLMLGKQAYHEYHLKQIWYMPSRQPPHKRDHQITDSSHREKMVKLAIKRFPYFKFSDYELIRTEGNTYTADTLRLLKRDYPDTEFFFIVGADSVFEIEKWYQPETVMRLATILAADRDSNEHKQPLDDQIKYLEQRYGAKIFRLHCREMIVASAEIRERIQKKESIEHLTPTEVAAYIKEHKLYQ